MGDIDTTQEELDDPIAVAPDGGEFVLTAQNVADLVSGAEDFLQAQNVVQDRIAAAVNGNFGANSGLEADMWTSVLDAMQAGQLPYTDVQPFFNWLRGPMNMYSIPPSLVQGGGFNQLLAQYAVERLGMDIPTYVAPAPPELPSPSVGQTTVAKGAREVVPSQVASPAISSEQASAISAAIGIATADILKVQAAVVDAMLPNLKPGQVTQALDQLNTATNALENQMTGVLTTLNKNATGSLAAQLNGALEALHGLAQEVNTLAEQMGEKASSQLETDLNTNTAEIGIVGAGLATVVGTTIPVLEGQLGTLTGQVNSITDKVNDDIAPELTKTTAQTAANTDMLSGTDKDCLDALCDAEGNVIDPITEGGATPSLLKKLGGLLGGFFAAEGIMALVTTLETLLNAPAVYSAVVQDMPTMATWAEQAANVIATDLSWSGPIAVKA